MDPSSIERDGTVERYVSGRLEPADREAFERWFFSDDTSFETVRVALAIRAGFVAIAESSAPHG